MQTIEDGMIKSDLIEYLKVCDVRGVAETSAALVGRRQQRMIIDACMELVHLMNPAYTMSLLKLFKTCNTIDKTCKLITLSFRGIREAAGDTTAVDEKVSDTIASIIHRAATRPGLDVEILKGLPLKIGKKWKGIASCCVRVIKERTPQRDIEPGAELLDLLRGEVPVSKKNAPLEEDEAGAEARRLEEIKLGALWTFTRGPGTVYVKGKRPPPHDKIIAYSGPYDPDVGSGRCGVLRLR